MKTLLSLKLWLAVCLFAVSGVSAASIWAPTDSDVSFKPISFTGSYISTDSFGIFEDDADLSVDAPVVSFTGLDWVTFTAVGGDYSISTIRSGLTNTLIGSSHFQLGFLSGGVWSTDVGIVDDSTSPLVLGFTDSGHKLHFLKAFGIEAVSLGSPSAVPLPASVWFMTSALLGFLYTGRRKSAVQA